MTKKTKQYVEPESINCSCELLIDYICPKTNEDKTISCSMDDLQDEYRYCFYESDMPEKYVDIKCSCGNSHKIMIR